MGLSAWMAAGISNGMKSLSSSATTRPRAGVSVTESCYHVKAIGWPTQNEVGWLVSLSVVPGGQKSIDKSHH